MDYPFIIIDENGKITFDKEKMLEVTDENYYSMLINQQYMNSTQYKNWIKCEAKEKAIQDGKWEDGEKPAFILGNYLHSWNDGTMNEYLNIHSNMLLTKSRTKNAGTKKIDKIITTFENDELIMFMLKDKDAQKEPIFVAEMFGVWWKVRIDDWNPKFRRMIDLKTTRGIHFKMWDNVERKYVSFIEGYNYPLQMAIYEKIIRLATEDDGRLEVFIIAGEKVDVPDKALIDMTDHERFDIELEKIKLNMDRILKVKYGLEEPIGCGKCDYCKAVKQLKESIFYKDIELD